MNQKKLIQIAIITVIGVWVFCLSTVASVTIGRKMLEDNTTAAPSTTLTQPTTQAPTTSEAPTTRLPIGGNIVTSEAVVEDPEWLIEEEESKRVSAVIDEVNKNSTTKPTASSGSVPSGKSEIIKTYTDAVNKLKKTSDFSLYKDDILNVTIDSITGGSVVQGLADTIMSQNQKAPITYNFAGGVDAATGLTPNEAIAPLGISASVDENAVTSATAKSTKDGGFTVSISITSEEQTMSSPAPNHATMVEVVDVTPLIPSGATVNYVNMTYTNTKIDAVFDNQGRITSMVHYLNVDKADASARYMLIPIEVSLHGEFTSNYTFSY